MKKKLLFLIGLLCLSTGLYASNSSRPHNPDSPWGVNLLEDLTKIEKHVSGGYTITSGNRIGLISRGDSTATIDLQIDLQKSWEREDIRFARMRSTGNGLKGSINAIIFRGWWSEVLSNSLDNESIPVSDTIAFHIENPTKDTLWIDKLSAFIFPGDTFYIGDREIIASDENAGSIEYEKGTYYIGEKVWLNIKPNEGYYFDKWSSNDDIDGDTYLTNKPKDTLICYFEHYRGSIQVNSTRNEIYVEQKRQYFKDKITLKVYNYHYRCANVIWSDGYVGNTRIWDLPGDSVLSIDLIGTTNKHNISSNDISMGKAFGFINTRPWDLYEGERYVNGKYEPITDTIQGDFITNSSIDTSICLVATPQRGYRFSHWENGNRDSVRFEYFECDSSHHYIAYFEPTGENPDTIDKTNKNIVNFEISSNNKYAGEVIVTIEHKISYQKDTVSGNFVFDIDRDTTVEIYAHAYAGYKFIKWSDGITDVQRRFTRWETGTNSTINLIAYFSADSSLIETYPDSVYVSVIANNNNYGSVEGGGWIQVGDSLFLKAVPAYGYKFDGWNAFWGNIYTATVNDTIVAHFSIDSSLIEKTPDSVYVSVIANNNNYGSVEGGGWIQVGDSLFLKAVPAYGYKFDGWNAFWGNIYTATVNDTIVAHFSIDSSLIEKTPDSVYVSVIANNNNYGSVEGGGWIQVGDSLFLKAVPAYGYKFDGWNAFWGNIYTATVNDTIIAHFSIDSSLIEKTPDSVYVSVIANNNNYGSVEGGGWIQVGDSLFLKAVPAYGYKFDGWNAFWGNIYTATVNDTIVAHFSIDSSLIETYPDSVYIFVISSDDSLGYVRGGGYYTVGDTAIISATAKENAVFERWSDGDTKSTKKINCTTDLEIKAIFKKVSTWSENIAAEEKLKEDTSSVTKKLFLTIDLTSLSLDNNQMKHVTLQASVEIAKNSTCEAKVECYADAACTQLLGTLVLKNNLSDLFNGMTLYREPGKKYAPAITDNYSETASIPEGTNYLKVILEDEDAATIDELQKEFTDLEVQIARKSYNVELTSDENKGIVIGSGEFLGGNNTRIEAIAAKGYTFVKWSDGNNDAIRDIVVEDDMLLEAIFEEVSSIGTESEENIDSIVNVYTIEGRIVKLNVRRSEALNGLDKGFYVVGNEKVKVLK